MFLWQDDSETPPLLISILVILTFIGIACSIIVGLYRSVMHYIDLFVNKKYYNRNLLVLASKIIKADGAINKIEQGFVRKHFIKNYGKRKANKAFIQFKKITLDSVSIEETCKKVYDLLTYQERFDFIKFLFGIAYSDGKVTKGEELEIRKIASYLHLRKKEYLYLKSLFLKDFNKKQPSNYFQASNYNYEALGLLKSVTDIEIKNAYRTLVKNTIQIN